MKNGAQPFGEFVRREIAQALCDSLAIVRSGAWDLIPGFGQVIKPAGIQNSSGTERSPPTLAPVLAR